MKGRLLDLAWHLALGKTQKQAAADINENIKTLGKDLDELKRAWVETQHDPEAAEAIPREDVLRMLYRRHLEESGIDPPDVSVRS